MNRLELINCVERAAAHDSKAVETLYHVTYASVYSLANHLCANENDVEDILQESYIIAFSRLDTLKEKAAFPAWLRKIVVNTWRGYAKEKSNIYELPVYDVADEQFDDWQHTESVEKSVELSETNREIMELVQTLPEHQRVCVVLYYYEDMKIEEIAETLGIPTGSVKSRLHYGRLKLKEGMKQRGIHSYGSLTAPAAEAAASETVLAKILAALGTASGSGTAAGTAATAGLGTAGRIALTVAALATAGGIASGIAMRPQPQLPEPPAPVTTRTTASATAATTTVMTTAATTASTAATTTTATTAPRTVVSFDYQTTEDGIVLTQYTGNEPDVVIPDTLNGMPVVEVGAHAFAYSGVPESVTIPSTVRTVGSGAFRECRNLRSVSLGSGVQKIGSAAFLGCAVQSVNIPANVKEIGVYAFAYCPSLTEVRIAQGAERVGYAAFRDCPNLRQATLPASVRSIGDDSFDGASPGFRLTAPEDTYAYQYALAKGFF